MGSCLFLTGVGTLHIVHKLSQRTDSKFYVFLQGPVHNQLKLSSDRVSIDLTTDVDSVSISCTSHESTQEGIYLGHSHNLHSAAAIHREHLLQFNIWKIVILSHLTLS